MSILLIGALCFAAGMIVGVIFHAVLKTNFHTAAAAAKAAEAKVHIALAPNHTATVAPDGTTKITPAA